MLNYQKILIATSVLALTFYAGRFSKPAVVKIETVEVIKTQVVKEAAKEKIVTVEKIVYKDGTTKETTKTEDRDSSKESSNTESTKVANSETIRDTGISLNALAIVDATNIQGHRDYGIFASKRVFSNVSVGVMATTDKKIGLSLGLSF
jgi:hypothetical protein